MISPMHVLVLVHCASLEVTGRAKVRQAFLFFFFFFETDKFNRNGVETLSSPFSSPRDSLSLFLSVCSEIRGIFTRSTRAWRDIP